MGCVLVGLGVISVSGYLVGIKITGWGAVIDPMAVHTAGGFAVLGVGVAAYALGDARTAGTAAPRGSRSPSGSGP